MISRRALIFFVLSSLLFLSLALAANAEDRSSFLSRIERHLPADCHGKVHCLAIWIGYALPENPDLAADARTQESKCLNARIVTKQACSESDACARNAELSFRRCVSGIRGAEFWVAADDPRNTDRVVRVLAIDSDAAARWSKRVAPQGSLDQRLSTINLAGRYVWTGHVYVFKRSPSGSPLNVLERSCSVVTDVGEDDVDRGTYLMRTETAGCTSSGVCAYRYYPDDWNIWARICDKLYDKIF